MGQIESLKLSQHFVGTFAILPYDYGRFDLSKYSDPVSRLGFKLREFILKNIKVPLNIPMNPQTLFVWIWKGVQGCNLHHHSIEERSEIRIL